jgi:protein required for attachment to host cells
MDIPNETLILVADGDKALFLRNKGDAEFPNLVVEGTELHQNPRTRELGSDRPGRTMDDLGHRAAMEETDWHRMEKGKFASELAAMLFQQAEKNRFEKLIVAMPPQLLGELRKHLHKTVADRIIGDVAKDLTRMPVYEIETHLKKEA